MLKLVLLYFISLKVSFQKTIDDIKWRLTVLEIVESSYESALYLIERAFPGSALH